MRAIAATAVVALLVTTLAGAAAAKPKGINECKLLTDAQAEAIMGVEPYGKPAPDNGGCSWQTDPYDRETIAYVTLKVEKAAPVLSDYGGDLRTYLDESTNVGIDELADVGDEAFTTYSPLSGPGTVDGVSVLVGKQLLQLGIRPVETVENPSAELDELVGIVKKVVAKVQRAS